MASTVNQQSLTAAKSHGTDSYFSNEGRYVVLSTVTLVTTSHNTDSCLSGAEPGPRSGVTVPPDSSRISYWKLDESGTGATAVDSGSVGANATDNQGNTTASTTAPIAAPVTFTDPHGRFFPASAAPGVSGIKTYLNAGVQSAHGFTNNFTVTAWVRCAGRTTNQPFIAHALFVADGVSLGWNLVSDQNSLLGFTAGDGTNQDAALTSEFTLPLNVWTHVAALITGSGGDQIGVNPHIAGGETGGSVRHLYFNGQKSVNSDNKQPGASPNVATCLGKDFTGIDNFYFDGDLDDVRIYNVALTDDQVSSLAGGFDPATVTTTRETHTTDTYLIPHSNLISYWKLDEAVTGAIAVDSGISSSNATDNLGNITASTTVPIAAPVTFTDPHGRFFPSVAGTQLVTAVQPLHSFTQNFTVACWVRTSKANNSPFVTHGSNAAACGWELSTDATGVLIFTAFTSAGGNTARAADFVTPTGVWFHVAGVATTTTRYLYLNGQKSVNTNSVLPAASPNLATTLGWAGLNIVADQLNGDLDDVRIYNIALTDAQIASLAAGNDPFGITTVTKTHTTDALLFATAAKVHTVDALLHGVVAQTHTTNTVMLGAPSNSGFLSMFGRWLGGVGRPSVIEDTTHTTDAFLCVPVTKSHHTDAFVRATIARTHTTDNWASKPGTVVLTCTTDADLKGSLFRTHTTDNLHSLAVSLIHTTDVLVRATVAVVHHTDTLCDRTVATVHHTGALLLATVTRGHTTNSFLPTTVAKTHTTDAGLRWSIIQTHTTDTRVEQLGTHAQSHNTDAALEGSVIRTHTTDAKIVAVTTDTMIHATDAKLRATAALLHTTDSLFPLTVRLTYSTDALLRHTDINTHGTNTLCRRTDTNAHYTTALLRATYSIIHTTDAWIVNRYSINNKTDAMLSGTKLRTHLTDTRMVWNFARTHSTDTSCQIIPVAHHTTDALLQALGLWLPNYVSSLMKKTLTHIHFTDTYPCVFQTVFHHTGAMLVVARTHIHTTNTKLGVTRSPFHTADAMALHIPIVTHGTITDIVIPRSHYHTTGTMIVPAPIVGRWASMRTGTRTPAQIASKDRQQGPGNLYPVGFLMVSHDRLTPVLGVLPLVQLSKNGASWVPAVGIVTEVGDGWYQLAGDPADRDMPGEVVLMATVTGAEKTWGKFDVVVPDPYDFITLSPAERTAAADVTLTRAFASAASAAAHSVIQAIRSLWYWKTVQAKPMTITAEDGTIAWQAQVIIDPTIGPIRSVKPLPPPPPP